jgi:HEAT repeat protein
MKKISVVLLLLASAASVGMGLLGYGQYLFAEAAVYESEAQASTAQAAAHNRNFINVDGADLRTRLDAAIKLGRARSPQTRFWTAYTFDVRPGLGIDVVIMSSGGSVTIVNGVVSGSSGKYETRNVGVFLLHERDGGSIIRAELYNLERAREYAGYPVFWLGRGGNQESLDLLTKLIKTSTDRKVAEKLTDGVGAHDDLRVEGLLKELIRSSPIVEVRETAVSWVGRFPGNIPFLSDIARNEREHREVRKEAIDAIGQTDEAGAVAALKNLFSSLLDRELRKEIVEAAAQNREEDAAVDFLIKVAEGETDREVGREAIEGLGQMRDRRSFAALVKIAGDPSADVDSQREAAESIGEREKDEALPALKNIIKTHPRADVRREAIEAVSEMEGEAAFLEEIALDEKESLELRKEAIDALGDSNAEEAVRRLEKLYRSISNRELKKEVIEAIEDSHDKAAATDLLIKIARAEQDREARARAVSLLGEMNEDRAADFLFELYSAGQDEQIKEDVLEALGESSTKRSLQKLIDIARSDPSPKLRKKAVQLLSERDDPEAIKFLEGIIK